MEALSFTNQFQALRRVSPNVEDYLQRELYRDEFRLDAEGDVTAVLKECYGLVLSELQELGIQFTLDLSELLGDWYTAHYITVVREFLEADHIKTVFNQEERLSKLEAILDQERNNDYKELFADTLDILREEEETILANIDYIVPFITSDINLHRHLSAIVKNMRDIDSTLVTPDIQRAGKYLEKIKLAREQVKLSVEQLQVDAPRFNDRIDHVQLKQLLNNYDTDKINATDLHIYARIDLDEVPEVLQAYKTKMLDIHHRRSQHHIEYYLSHKQIPSPTQILVMIAHFAEPDTPLDKVKEELQELQEKGAPVLGDIGKQMIEVYSAVIKPAKVLTNKTTGEKQVVLELSEQERQEIMNNA